MTELIADVDVAVIGAGVVGCAIARALAQSGCSVALLDAAHDVGTASSKANTAIVHTGFDTVPGTLESSLVARGSELLHRFADDAGIALERTGALLVAWDGEQAKALEGLLDKAHANGCLDAALIDSAEVRRREPQLGPLAGPGLEVPGESIIDPWSVTLAFAVDALRSAAQLFLGRRVLSVAEEADGYLLGLDAAALRSRWVINAAGLSSDVIDRLFGHDDFRITARRGQLLVIDKRARGLLEEIILPVPTERTKGVLVAPTVFGNVLVGPTAEDLDDRSDHATTAEGIDSLRRAAERILPGLAALEVTALYAGLRAATEHRDYQIRCHAEQRYVCVGGIRSTGLTASMAIAERVVGLLREAGGPIGPVLQAPAPPRMAPLGAAQRRPSFDPDLISSDAAYGAIICHCEQVSLGELRDAAQSELPPTDLDGLRRRTRAMNGRCQGFFCGAELRSLAAAMLPIPDGRSSQ